ncbi:MAG: MarC family protein [Planctomycetaceae bacterium]|nr:MarC family protein [Planctomycetaceae bacterium]
MNLFAFALLAFSSLIVIIDPLALVPVFLAMTPNDTPAQRIRTAKLACTIAAFILIGFGLIGKVLFRYLGITMPAFQMAGSVVLLLIALDMLHAQRSTVHETAEETNAGTAKDDIAITPLAVPMLAGPGAISTAILLHSKAQGFAQEFVLHGSIIASCLTSFLLLRLSAHGARWFSPIAMKIGTRLMGLLLAAIAFQFFLNALRELKIIPSI